jgi:Ca2+-binding RTX toxin-like protein
MNILIAFIPLLWTTVAGQDGGGTSGDTETNYEEQIIAVLGDDALINMAAHYLYEKHPEVSNVVKWNTKDNKFELAKWNAKTERYEFDAGKDIPPLPDDSTRVQVVGHGTLDEGTGETKLGGLLPDELSKGLKELPGVEEAGHITRVSLVGCSVGKLKDNGEEFVGNEYPKSVLETLHKDGIDTEVSSRVGVVGVDSTGRKVVGEINADDKVIWRSNEGYLKKTVVRYEGSEIKITKVPITSGDSYIKPRSLVWKNRAEKRSLLSHVNRLEDFALLVSENTATETYYFDHNDLFDMVSDIAEEAFNDIDVPDDWLDQITSEKIVRRRDGSKEILKVREFRNVEDVMKEIKFFGKKGGFEYPRNIDGKLVDTDKDGNAFEDRYVHYRFGDWVVNMKYQAEKFSMNLNPWYAHMEGIIHAEDPSNPSDTKNEDVEFPSAIGKVDYPTLLPKTDALFFPEAQAWMAGNNENIRINDESAYNAVASIALFIPESIREYRAWVSSKIGMDLYNHEAMTAHEFQEAHPMARGGVAPCQFTGMRETLWESLGVSGKLKDWPESPQGVALKLRFARIATQWLSVYKFETTNDDGDKMEIEGENLKRKLDDGDTDTGSSDNREQVDRKIKECISEVTKSESGTASDFIHVSNEKDIAGPLGDGPWDARLVDVPEIDTTQTEYEEYEDNEDRSMSGRASEAIDRDLLYLSEVMNTALEEHGKGYEVDESSVSIDKGKLKFTAYDPEDPEMRETFDEELDESKLSSEDILNEMKQKGHEEGIVGKVGRVQSIYGTILGIQGTIEMFKEGDITNGVINLLQTAHGLGELTGINKKISEAASRSLGKYLNDDVAEVRNIGEDIVEGEGAKVLAGDAEELAALGSEVGEATEGIPIIGTIFGVYNIYEDLKQHTVIGYVDAGLDTLITVAGLFGPEAEPVVVVLMAIRMTIDTFYNDIKKELDRLPPDASVSAKVGAVFKGIGESLLHIADFLTGGIFSAPSKAHSLDKEYEKDQEFIKSLADYHNYYSIAAGPDSTEINFAGGEVSWNGGDVVFTLHDDHTAVLTMRMTDEDGVERTHTEVLTFSKDIKDVVMGIGESHTVHFTKESVKVLWFIPVDKKTIIDGIEGDRATIHGTYTGNKENNNFYAVQELPPDVDLDYTLEDYHYIIKGGDGDDSFFLGPQHNYVEGNEGSDAYFINITAAHTVINNYASDGVDDYLVINRTYKSLYLHRKDYDLNVTSNDGKLPLSVIVQNWFTSKAYQHMHVKCSDGIVFTTSVLKNGTILTIPYSLVAPAGESGVIWDATKSNFSHVEYISGTDGVDMLWGNDLDNIIAVAKDNAEDIMGAGNGTDTYDLTLQTVKGQGPLHTVEIDNYAIDNKNDMIILPFSAALLSLEKYYDSLRINYRGEYKVSMIDWFKRELSRHALLITNDSDVMGIKTTNNVKASLYPIVLSLHSPTTIDLSQNETYKHLSAVAVIGSPYDDVIIGSSKQNYIRGGGGKDLLSGGEGQDVYIVKEGDGEDEIMNLAYNQEQDLLLFDEDYDDLRLEVDNPIDLVIYSYQPHKPRVKLRDWYVGPLHQHLQVRTKNGIDFLLPTVPHLNVKTPVALDRSDSDRLLNVQLNSTKMLTIERVIGTEYNDRVIGNDLDNYLDLRAGHDFTGGFNGSDTYIFKRGYETLTVNNFAEDNVTDSLVLMVPFDGILCEHKDRGTILLNVTLPGNTPEYVVLLYYMSDYKYQHLQITTSDGLIFVIPSTNQYQPVIVGINKVHDSAGQFIDLTSSNYSRVIADYGANNFTNHITGNDMNNTLVGGIKDDYLCGGEGNDVLKGGAGNNTLRGGDGDDVLVGGSDTDMMEGGPGDDAFFPGPGHNEVLGGDGDDTVIYMGDPFNADGIIADLGNGDVHHNFGVDYVDSIENLYGTPFNDTVTTAGHLDNVVAGMKGEDVLIALGGYDILIGGEGEDMYDLTNAWGTKVIINDAQDGIMDTVILPYHARDIRYERQDDHLILHIVSTRFYPNNNTEAFNACNGQAPPQSVDLYPPNNNTNCTDERSDSSSVANVGASYLFKMKSNENINHKLMMLRKEYDTSDSYRISLFKSQKRKNRKHKKKGRKRPKPPGKSTTSLPRARTDAPTTPPPTTPPPTTPPPTTPPPTTPPPTTPPPTTPPPTNPPPTEEEEFVPFCEAYDTGKPTVVLKDFFQGPDQQHIQIETAECVIGMDYLLKMPIIVNCILPVC